MSSSLEEELESGLFVRIKEPSKIYDYLSKNQEVLTLGRLKRKKTPCEGIYSTALINDKRALSFKAEIHLNQNLTKNQKLEEILDKDILEEHFDIIPDKTNCNMLYILDEDERKNYSIEFGKEKISILARPIYHNREDIDEKKFNLEIEQFAETIEVVCKSLFKKYDQNHRKFSMYWEAPRFTETHKKNHHNSRDKSTKVMLDELEKVITPDFEPISFEEIGGQDNAIVLFQDFLIDEEYYEKWNPKKPKGILLTGPPGNGKTLLAKALATQTKRPFYELKFTDFTSHFFSTSENKLNSIFEIVNKNNGILLLDEMDSIGRMRQADDNNLMGGIVSTLLINMNGLKSSRALIIGTTNCPENIDEALRRPGRLDREIEVHYPDQKGREKIFKIHTNYNGKEDSRFRNINYNQLGILTRKYSGADIAEIVNRTLLYKVRMEHRSQIEQNPVSMFDFKREISNYERAKEISSREYRFGRE